MACGGRVAPRALYVAGYCVARLHQVYAPFMPAIMPLLMPARFFRHSCALFFHTFSDMLAWFYDMSRHYVDLIRAYAARYVHRHLLFADVILLYDDIHV